MDSSDLAWALHSEERESILDFVLNNSPMAMQWELVKVCGALFWLRLDKDYKMFEQTGEKLLRKKLLSSSQYTHVQTLDKTQDHGRSNRSLTPTN